MKLMISTAAIAASLFAAGASAQTVFNLDTLPTGASGTYASYQPTQDYTALGLGTIASAQGVLNQTVNGATLSLRTADYVYSNANPTAPQTRIGVENESTNFGYLGVPASVQVAITADTGAGGVPGAIFANFTNFVSALSVSTFTFTTNPGFSATLVAYSGLNGTGNILGTATTTVGAGTSYRASTLSLSGLSGAESFSVQGSNVLARYDTFTATLGAVIPAVTPTVPEPATWAMMLIGFAMVGATARYRRRNTAVVFA